MPAKGREGFSQSVRSHSRMVRSLFGDPAALALARSFNSVLPPLLRGLAIAAALVALWQAVVMIFAPPPFMLPPPLRVWQALVNRPELWLRDAPTTLAESVIGLVAGAVTGVLLALLMLRLPLLVGGAGGGRRAAADEHRRHQRGDQRREPPAASGSGSSPGLSCTLGHGRSPSSFPLARSCRGTGCRRDHDPGRSAGR